MKGKTGKTAFNGFAKEYTFWAERFDSAGYDEAMTFLPPCANRVLDAGCGSGILELQLADHVNYMVGMDISQAMIAIAKARQAGSNKRNVDFVVADIENPPFREGTFDFVVSNGLLHNTRIDVTLPSLSRLVKPRGRMVICDFVTLNPRLDTFPLWHVLRALRRVPRHARSYSIRATLRLLLFQISPGWVRHLCNDKKLTPELFRNIYTRFLPGCRFERNPQASWKMTGFWEAPASS